MCRFRREKRYAVQERFTANPTSSSPWLPMKANVAPRLGIFLRHRFRPGLFLTVFSFEFLELLLQPLIVFLKPFEL